MREVDERDTAVDGRLAELEERQRGLDGQFEALADEQDQFAAKKQDLQAGIESHALEEQRLQQLDADLGRDRKRLDQELQRVQELHQSLDEDRQELARRQEALAEQARRRADFADGREQITSERATELEALEADIDARRDQIDQAQARVDEQLAGIEAQREELVARESEIEKIVESLKGRDASFEQQDVDLAQRAGALDERAQALEDRAKEIEKSKSNLEAQEREFDQKQSSFKQTVKQAQQKVAKEMAHARDKHQATQDAVKRVESQQKRVREADRAVESRRAKLHRYRRLLRERSAAIVDAKAKVQSGKQQYEGLLKQKQLVVEAKRFLATSEDELVRRWAVHRGITVAMVAVVCTVGLAVASFFAGQRLATPVWRATTALSFDLQSATPSVPQWSAQVQKMIFSEAVARETINQLGQRGYRPFDDAAALSAHLSQTLTVNVPQVGRLELEYRDTDSELSVFVLESIGRAIVGYQMARDRAAERENTASIAQAAARDRHAVEDRSLIMSAQLFGGTMAASALLGIVAFRFMLRSRRVIGDAAVLEPLEDEELWPPAETV
ncbi:MAG: hypothetical protein CMJ18_23800 [Phycisphaeraceae bacterium]|nr:hypothetical protein [Phycisphaeraceae bacterium]